MLMLAALASSVPENGLGQSLTLSGGVDGRGTYETHPTDRGLELRGLFLNLRQVWSDETGDRWIGVAQADLDHDLEELRPYQVYLQYKGPLGRWNVRAGHFLLPFGLLATHDTERLVLQGLEEESLGLRKDTGGEVLGRFGSWDYALSISSGVGDRRLLPVDGSRLLAGRLAYVADDWQTGVSLFAGSVLVEDRSTGESSVTDEWRVAADSTWMVRRLTLRAEAVGGESEGRAVGGGIALADFALSDRVELNARAAYWSEPTATRELGLGVTVQPKPHLFLRLADSYDFEKERNAVTVQVYFEFSHVLH